MRHHKLFSAPFALQEEFGNNENNLFTFLNGHDNVVHDCCPDPEIPLCDAKFQLSLFSFQNWQQLFLHETFCISVITRNEALKTKFASSPSLFLSCLIFRKMYLRSCLDL